MSTAVTMERFAEVSPRLKARLAGVLYFLTGVVAFDEFAVLGRLVVHGVRRPPQPTSWRTSFCFDWASPPRLSRWRAKSLWRLSSLTYSKW